MSDGLAQLPVLVLPNPGGDLILPVGAVAEIVRGQGIQPAPTPAPAWVIGAVNWRGCCVSLIRMTARAPQSSAEAPSKRLIVCFAPGRDVRLPFLALESPGLPRLERVTAADLAPDPDERPAIPLFVSHALRLRGRPSWLVDLDAAEQALLAG